MALAEAIFVQRVLRRVSEAGLARARQAILSRGSVQTKQLFESLETIEAGEIGVGVFESILVTSPYYAVYVHDGSGPATRDFSKPPFIWFRDPLLDPRLDAGRTPPRVNQLRHLTGDQFKAARDAGQLIITRQIGRRRANPFFSNEPDGGMFGFIDEVAVIVHEETSRTVRETMGSLMNVKGSVTITL